MGKEVTETVLETIKRISREQQAALERLAKK
jgi:hypothetical protein